MTDPQEYRIILDGVNIQIVDLDGQPLKPFTLSLLMSQLQNVYTVKHHLYLCHSLNDPRLLKIGRTSRLYRRMNELQAHLLHSIPCNANSLIRYETEILRIFSRWRITKEWFDFGEDREKAIALIKTINTQHDLEHWLLKHWYPRFIDDDDMPLPWEVIEG